MRQSGFDEPELQKIEHDLTPPPPDRIAAIRRLMTQHDVMNTEIAARLLLEDCPGHAVVKPFRHPDGKRMALPRSVIHSRATIDNPAVKHAKHSVWNDVSPNATVPINAQALEQFIQCVPNSSHQLHALRLLRLSRNTLCAWAIPVQYRQVSTGRLVEELFYLQSTPREVMSAALTGFWDYDIKNAHFAIFSQWANKLGKRTPVVDWVFRCNVTSDSGRM